MTKIGNYNIDYIYTYYETEGYYDRNIYESSTDDEKLQLVAYRRKNATTITDSKGEKKFVYEFLMTPNDPFLNENKPLPPGVELQLSFDRLISDFSVLNVTNTDPMKGKILELKNVYASVEYVTSDALRTYSDRISATPIPFIYDECTVLYKALPLNDQQIRLENIRGGNTPDYVFIGIIETEKISGSTKTSAIEFKSSAIKEFNLTLNGSSCLGFPLKIENNFPIWPFLKFHDTLGNMNNSTSANQFSLSEFKEMSLFSHKFEGEDATQGWLGVGLTLNDSTGFTKPHTLGKKE